MGEEIFSKEVDELKFKCQWMRIFLTYKTHLDKAMYKTLANDRWKPKELWIAHESGDKTHAYEHTHVYIDFGRTYNTRNPRHFDVEDIHPNIRPVTCRSHTEHIRRYMCKEDTSNLYLLEAVSCADVIWRKNTIQDAIRTAKRPSDVPGIVTAWKYKPDEFSPKAPEQWRPWQQQILDIIEEEPDDRTIYWLIDKKGGCGKTFLTKYLAMTGKAFVVSAFGGTRDISTVISGAIASGWDKRVFIADLPRSAEVKAIYEPLEAIKNGLITSTKYEGRTMVFKSPHVIVFANFEPNVRALSRDRWGIGYIRKGTIEDAPRHT